MHRRFRGLFYDDAFPDSHWLRDRAELSLPASGRSLRVRVQGRLLSAAAGDATARGPVGLCIRLGTTTVFSKFPLGEGGFTATFQAPPAAAGATEQRITLQLLGVAASNAWAWLGRVCSGAGAWGAPFQPWRRQAKNRRLRLEAVEIDGATLFDFSDRLSPWQAAAVRPHLELGMNLLGFFRADLGLGESVRCAARAVEAAGIPHTLLDLKLPCTAPMTDESFADRLAAAPRHGVNVVHLDPPVSSQLDFHHPGLRPGRINIGYWAWELPEFPDSWLEAFRYFDEIWTPSEFTRAAIAAKSPRPVFSMPHAIAFARPVESAAALRAKFGLPPERFLFLFLCDLSSYAARKNPGAVVEAYERAFAGAPRATAGLVVKVHNAAANPAEAERLRRRLAALPGAVWLEGTFSRRAITELQSACDCFVSLHRSEGYGLALAESMYLEKPVIATDWSGSTQFVDETTGVPVRCSLVELPETHGPYRRGQVWAEPDVDHAAEAMRRLYDDPALGRNLGAAGRARIEREFSPAAIGARYRQRLEAIALW